MQQPSDMPLQTLVGLSINLALGHLAAALVALSIGSPTYLAVIAGVVAGLLVTAALQRSMWLITNALDRLSRGLSAAEISTRWHFWLTALITRLNVVLERVNSITALRDGLVRQTGEAAAQQERNRLARDLHDSIKQQVFSISMSAAAVEARWEADQPGARKALEQVRQSAKEALVEMTALLQQLSPAPLEKVGLVQALRDQCEALGYRTGAQVTTTIGDLPPDDRLPAGAPESLFRIVQEALSNIARHARAPKVEVKLEQRGDLLVMEVRDDGQGFDRVVTRHGMGLANIQGRVTALGGRLSMESTPHKGSRLAIEIPLLEALFAQEDVMIIKAEHTLNRTILAGAGGGLALIAALFYPLYIDWPGRFVEDWFIAQQEISLALSALGILILPVTGFAAARWAHVGRRAAGTVIGALAGWIAALAAYVILIGPAAGVGASRAILEWGYRPALGEPHALWLTAEPVINSVYWTYIALWLVQIAGVSLGALGGTFAPPSEVTVSAPELRHAAATIAGLVAFVFAQSQVIAPAIYSLMEGTLTGGRNSSTGVPMAEAVRPYVFTLPPEGVSLVPTLTALSFFALSLGVLFQVRATQRQAGDPVELTGGVALSFVYVLLPAAVAYFSFFVVTSEAFPALSIVCVAASLGFAGLFLVQAIGDVRRRKPGEPLFAEWNPLILIVVVMTLIPILTPLFGLLPSSRWTGLVLFVIGLIGLGVVYRFYIRPTGIPVGTWLANRVRDPRIRPPHQFRRLWQGMLNVLSAGILIALLIMSQVISAALAMVMLVIPGLVPVYAYDKDPLPAEAAQVMEIGSAEMVRRLYLVHAQALGSVLLGIFVVIGLVLLTLRVWEIFVGRVAARSAEAAVQPQSQ